MGFLDLLRGKKSSPKPVGMLSEQELLEARENEILEFAYNSAINLCDELRELDELFERLSNKEISDVRVKKEKKLVERYCSVSRQQVTSLQMPDKNLPATAAFIKACANLSTELGRLSQREALRIRYFFEDEFRRTAEKVKAIDEQAQQAMQRLSALDTHDKVRQLKGESESLGTQRSDVEKRHAVLVGRLADQQQNLGEAHKEQARLSRQLADYEEQQKKLGQKQHTVEIMKQDADTYLSISRLLKRLRHDRMKDDSLLNEYIQTPHVALLKDEALKICDYIAEALTLPIEDPRLIQKSRSIDKAHVAGMRSQLLKSVQALEAEQHTLANTLQPLRDTSEKMAAKCEFLEKDVQETKRQLAANEKEQAALEERRQRMDVQRQKLVEVAATTDRKGK